MMDEIIEALKTIIPEDKIGDTKQLIENYTEGLVKKNRELLGKIKNFDEKAKKLDFLKKTDYNELVETKKAYDELIEKRAKEEGDYQTLLDSIQKKHAREVEDLQKKLSETAEVLSKKDQTLSKHLIENSLTSSLASVGVKKEFLAAAKALLSTKAKLIPTEDGDYSAVLEDAPINEYISKWASSEGKAFIAAQASGGGVREGEGGKRLTIDEIEKIPDRAQRIEALKEAGIIK